MTDRDAHHYAISLSPLPLYLVLTLFFNNIVVFTVTMLLSGEMSPVLTAYLLSSKSVKIESISVHSTLVWEKSSNHDW